MSCKYPNVYSMVISRQTIGTLIKASIATTVAVYHYCMVWEAAQFTVVASDKMILLPSVCYLGLYMLSMIFLHLWKVFIV